MAYARRLDRHTVLGLGAIVLWSTAVALARSIAEQIGALRAGAAVYLVAAAFLGLHLFVKERSVAHFARLPRRYVLGCGALFVLYTVALYVALGLATNHSQTLEIGLLNYLWPTLTIVFALAILGQRARLGLIPGTLLALAGVFFVLTQSTAVTWASCVANVQRSPIAYGLATFAAVAWALYSNLTRRWAAPGGRGAVPLFVLATGLVFWLGTMMRAEGGAWSIRAATEIGVLALATGLAYVFWDIAMRAGDVVLVASCSYFTPFLSTAVSCLYLRVRPGPGLWLGCALIIAGSFLSWRSVHPTNHR